MVQSNSFLYISDNTGVAKVKIINLINSKTYQKIYSYNHFFICSIRLLKKIALKRKHLYKVREKHIVFLLRTTRENLRYDGSLFKFFMNDAILLKKNTKALAISRIYGPATREVIVLKKIDKLFSRIIVLSKCVV